MAVAGECEVGTAYACRGRSGGDVAWTRLSLSPLGRVVTGLSAALGAWIWKQWAGWAELPQSIESARRLGISKDTGTGNECTDEPR